MAAASRPRTTATTPWERFVAPEYWIFSQDELSVERLVLSRSKYVVEQVLTAPDVLKPGRFPGLEVPLTELFTLPKR